MKKEILLFITIAILSFASYLSDYYELPKKLMESKPATKGRADVDFRSILDFKYIF